MATRNTKRGSERTDLTGNWDLVICGASFAGLAVAARVAGTGAEVLIVDRYEIGERQTSACAIPTSWLAELDLLEAECQRFGELTVHTPQGSTTIPVPWEFSTFDYRTLCDLLWQRSDARFETAKVNGRRPGPGGGAVTIETDRGDLTTGLAVDALGWRRILDLEESYQPPRGPLSRAIEVHPAGSSPDLEVWIDRGYVPAGYGWSFPAGDELRVGVGSFDPEYHVRKPTEELARDLDLPLDGWQGNWIPHRMRRPTSDGVFFVGDSAGHCLPLTAEGIRPALYFGLALGEELRLVIEGDRDREEALLSYADFCEGHRPHFEGMLAAQKALPRIPPRLLIRMLETLSLPALGRRAFGKYLDIAPPGFARILSPEPKPVGHAGRLGTPA